MRILKRNVISPVEVHKTLLKVTKSNKCLTVLSSLRIKVNTFCRCPNASLRSLFFMAMLFGMLPYTSKNTNFFRVSNIYIIYAICVIFTSTCYHMSFMMQYLHRLSFIDVLNTMMMIDTTSFSVAFVLLSLLCNFRCSKITTIVHHFSNFKERRTKTKMLFTFLQVCLCIFKNLLTSWLIDRHRIFKDSSRELLQKLQLDKMAVSAFYLLVINLVLQIRQWFRVLNRRLRSGSLSVPSLRKLHFELHDATLQINRMFSPQLLLTITQTFLYITTISYFALAYQFKGIRDPRLDAVREAVLYIDACWFLSLLIGLTAACELTTREAKYTAVVVHKLLNRSITPETTDELQKFSLQLLHTKVQFTACGFFPVNFTLLYSVIGAVGTYLVILIQLQLSLGNRSL